MTLPTLEQLKKAQPTEVQGGGLPTLRDLKRAKTNPDDPNLIQTAIEVGKEEARAIGGNLAAGALRGAASLDNTTANLFMVMDRGAKFLSDKTGLSRGGAFRRVEEFFRTEARQLEALAEPLAGTNFPSKVLQLQGGLPLGLAQAGAAVAVAGPVTGFAGLGALSEADRGAKEAALAAVEGAFIGSIFKFTEAGVGPASRAGLVGTGTAAASSARGESPEDTALNAATTGVLAALGAKPLRRTLSPISEAELFPKKPRLRVRLNEETGKPEIVQPSGAPSEIIASDRPIVQIKPRTEPATKQFLDRDFSDLEVPDKAVTLNMKRIEGTQDFKRATSELVEFFRSEIDDARRGSIARTQTLKAAEDMGLKYEDMVKRNKGTALNAEQITAFRMMNRAALEEWWSAAQKVQSSKATDRDKVNFLRATAIAEESITQTLGASAEIGRALDAHNAKIGPSTQQMKQIRDLINDFRGPRGGKQRGGSIEDFADLVMGQDSVVAMNKFAGTWRKATTGDKLLEIWINSRLSGPQTHAVNILSNALFATYAIPESFLAAGISTISRPFAKGRLPEDNIFFRESLARTYGMIEGAKDGLLLARESLRTGRPAQIAEQQVGTKIETLRARSIGGLAGGAIRLPTRALLAEDAFFQAVGYRAELRALAMNRALTEKRAGKLQTRQDIAHRVVALERSPTDAMRNQALENAKVLTFTNRLGPAMQGFLKFTQIHPFLKLHFPFVRTPTNIFKQAAKRTPLGLAMGEVKAGLREGGRARDLTLARLTMGTGIMMWVAHETASGNITGSGPTDPTLRRTWLLNHQPFSFRIPAAIADQIEASGIDLSGARKRATGDAWISYSRIEPFATIVGIAADFSDITGHIDEKTAEELGTGLVIATTRNMGNKTFLQGATTLASVLADPKRFGPRYIQGLAGSLVPAAVTQFTRAETDPILRDVRSATDAIRKGIPGLSETVPPWRNTWGEPILLGGGLGPDTVSPFYTNRTVPDFTTDEVVRLEAKLTPPDRKVGTVELEPFEYDRLAAEGGQQAKRQIDAFTSSPLYKAVPDPVKREIIESLYSEGKSAAKIKLMARMSKQDPVRFREAQLGGTLVDELVKLRQSVQQ